MWCGKWLVFVPRDRVDGVWASVKRAVESGELGAEAKVSTAKPNPNANDPSTHVLCVYTYDVEDRIDVMRVREALRALGLTWKIPYKTDMATGAGLYAKDGHKRISTYYE